MEISYRAREILGDIEWLFYNWECNSVGYRDNRYKGTIMICNLRGKQGQVD